MQNAMTRTCMANFILARHCELGLHLWLAVVATLPGTCLSVRCCLHFAAAACASGLPLGTYMFSHAM